MGAQKSIEKPQWRATALAIAAAVLLGVSASDANALGLGRITVQSALGEPLRAEIDVPEINAEEISSLRTAVASPEAFRAAGFEFNPSLSGINISLQRRPDGRHFLQLSSTRAVNDPFVDLILETSWSSGRIVRDYTLLFDPPNLRPGAPLSAQVTPLAPAARAAAPAPSSSTRDARAPGSPAAPATRAPAERPATAAAPKPASAGGKQVTVQAGDTAGKIAAANKPANVSLDQMLVAMLRANPDAFVGGNVNRLRAGSVLAVPGADDAALVPVEDANQTLVVQSRDFNEFRRRLAEGLPTTSVAPAERQSSGKIQAQVQEKRPGASTPDKLTLSKGAVQGKAGEDKIARERAAKDAAARVAELNKNIADLNRLSAASGPAGTGASGTRPGVAVPVAGAASGPAKVASATAPATKAASAPTTVAAAAPASAPRAAAAPAPVAAPVAAVAAASAAKPASAAPSTTASPMANVAVPGASSAVASASPAASAASASTALPAAATASAAASTPASATAPVTAAASAPAATPAASALKPPLPPLKVETSLVDDLLENPIVPAAVGGILAFLLGFGFYRAQQRKKSTQVDSSFLESRLQPDSFFGASGGQRIDTNEASPTGSSMVYSPSQLDAAGDVDPVAEADVYLAYGRDLQAEEILKEAMRTNPQRVAVHSKLLEIYAKRRDGKAFELVATEAYALTHGEGPEWEHICELGQELDASNPLYRPGGAPAEGAVAAAAAAAAAGGAFGATTVQHATQANEATQAVQAAPPVDLDLDLDFDLDAPADAPAVSAPAPAPQPTLALNVPPAPPDSDAMPPLDMDFGAPSVSAPAPTQPTRLEAPDLTLDENALSFDLDAPAAAPTPVATSPAPVAAKAAPEADAGMIEFDLGSLSLDLPGATAPAPAAAATVARAAPELDEGPPSTSSGALSTTGFEDTGGGDPLATKFALAQEFNAIGDPDGARSLAQEVIAEASGDLKSKAQKFLAEIG
jgi:pilus assembly protein FimV